MEQNKCIHQCNLGIHLCPRHIDNMRMDTDDEGRPQISEEINKNIESVYRPTTHNTGE